MADTCCAPSPGPEGHERTYSRVLWIVLIVNAAMFGVEVVSGVIAHSVALQADALDFLGDAANYGVALYVLGHNLKWRAGTALIKGIIMAGFGVYVLTLTAYRVFVMGVPDAGIMGSVGALALIANVFSAVLLYRYRAGDANMRAVWVCSRNDAIGNVLVIAAAGAVGLTATGWPDLGVAIIIAGLALWGATQIIRQSVHELKHHTGRLVASE
ncbi:MAG: cation transporter [Rhodospirillales bacterium]|nr:cation transporter [Rhodospirillales bacterium]